MIYSPSRRSLLGLLTALPAASLVRPAFAQAPYLDVRRGANFQPIPVAVTAFLGDGGAQLTSIVTNNFRRSVFLTPLDSRTFVEKATNPEAPALDQWKVINAQFVVTGRTGRGPDGRLKTEFRLWDVATGQ